MTPSDKIKDFIKSFESISLEAYRCPAGIPTIGWGHTKGVQMGQRITPQQAKNLFEEDVAVHAATLDNVLRTHSVPHLTQWQYDALFSFVFNVRLTSFLQSTLLRKVAANPNDPTIPDVEFPRWKYATINGQSKIQPGLVRRRLAEAKIYKSNIYPK